MGLLLFDIVIRRFSIDVAGGIRDFGLSIKDKITVSGKKEKRIKRKDNRKNNDLSVDEAKDISANESNAENVINKTADIDNKKDKKKEKKKEKTTKNKGEDNTAEKLDMNTLLQKKRDRN